MAVLRGVLLLTRDVGAAVEFYSRGLGMSVIAQQANSWAELDGGPLKVMVRQVERCAHAERVKMATLIRVGQTQRSAARDGLLAVSQLCRDRF